MPKKWYCMELWRATPEVLAMPHAERIRYAEEHLTISSDKPFPDGTFEKKTADISTVESALVMLFFAMLMGGPVLLLVSFLYSLLIGTWVQLASVIAIMLVLALHPLPDPLPMTTAPFTLSLYKYFSYRFMWADDAKAEVESCKGWIGAGAPHGVLPLANVLAMPALNAFTPSRFLGSGASVMLVTPFLRYLACFGGIIDVSKSSLICASKEETCIGIVPDGIAGIFQQNAGDNEERVALKKRKGLARLSLQTGIPIVPVYSLGNTEVFSVWYDSFGVMETLSRLLRVSMFVFWGRYGLPLPHRRNITMLISAPMKPESVTDEPSSEMVDSFHENILGRISEVFDLHKGACGWSDRKMRFV